ncbi:uncharacterized protein PGTG_02462 [Puccinia graminis f. sp. tritici CRL 75-36-700-3]|uniref:Uncharacterized protein n=1 Tax=Puccinia graminis f. sp. tritici (strain CRL 75-36-700-3 / race SCCL) TaxID=418459 RepID=E3JY76_PUCGT|nr:uncharacterized protein PGTG_02462 [Puccinia graminis f. sp. tritici CRL 75-36-700-3]EFP77001.1 hypothetical protein PGTG_02462 [Puccinia graminis f. sp. tritici CRL 75-36-700-3]
MVSTNTTDGFTVPSPRRSARLATVEPLSPQKKKPMSPTEKRAHELRNTPREDMELDVDVADKDNTAADGTNGSEAREMDLDEPTQKLSGQVGLTNFLGVGTQEACEFEFGNISPSDLSAEHLGILAQMVHVNNQIQISLSAGSSLQSSTPQQPGSPPKTPTSPKQPKSPKKSKGKQKETLPVPSVEHSIGFSPLSESHTDQLPMTSTPAAHTGEVIGFDFSTLGQSKRALPSDLDALVNKLVPMETSTKVTGSINKEASPVESNSARHPPAPVTRKKQVDLFMPKSISNQVRHNLPSKTQTLAQLDREMKTMQLPDEAAMALMNVKELQKMKESLKKVADAQLLAFKEMRSASGMVAFPGVLDGLMKNARYITRFMNHLEDKVLEASRDGRQEIEVIEISDGEGEEVSIMPRRRSVAELKDFMRPGLVRMPSHLNPPTKRSASSSSLNQDMNKRAKSQDILLASDLYLADLVPQFEPGAQKTVTQLEMERRELAAIQEKEIIEESNASTPPPYNDSAKGFGDPIAAARAALHRDRRRAAAEAALAADLAEAATIQPPPVPATTLATNSATVPASVPAQSAAPILASSQSAPPAAASASQSTDAPRGPAQSTAPTPAASQPAQEPAPSQPDNSQKTGPEEGAKKGKGKGKGKETVPEQPPKKL